MYDGADGDRVYLIVNRSEKAVDGWMLLSMAAKYVAIFDPMTSAIWIGSGED